MHFWPRTKSKQHTLLLDLEQTNHGSVFYYAPAFWQTKSLDKFFASQEIQSSSRRARPSDLAIPVDSKSHHFSFESAAGGKTFLFSDEPEERNIGDRPLQDVLASELAVSSKTPLAESLSNLESWFVHRELFVAEEAHTAESLTARGERNWVTRLDQLASWSAIHLNSGLFILQEPESYT
jgi:hypothetical protein